MSINEYNRLSALFKKDPNLKGYFIKLFDYVNFDGYLRREFHNGRNVKFEDNYVYFTVEHYTEFRDYELKVHYKDINLFIPSSEKKSKKLPLYLQDINFKEGFVNRNETK